MPVIHEDTPLLYCVWREPPTADATGTQSAIEPVLAQSVVAESTTPRALVIEAQPGAHLAATIERAETAMTATAVASVHEAQLALESPEPIDCVVLAGDLPDTDAPSFLAYVRETHPDMPVVCVHDTAPDPDVTSETEQRVGGLLVGTDTPGSDDQPPQRSERPSTEYQAAFETLPVPIVCFDHRQAIYLNGAFRSALGYDRDSIEEPSLIETVVHPGDRRRVTQLLADWQQGTDEQGTHIVRLCASDGSVRHFEMAGTPATMAGRSGVVVSLCDVTDQLQANQQTAFERGLARILLDQVGDAQTQAEFVTGVVEGLTQQGYALAWSGTVDGTDLNARAVAGDRQFYRTLKTALADDDGVGEPIVRAATTGTVQYVADIETLLAAPWRDAALDAGYRSSIAVPLSSHDTTDGVIAIYSRDPDPFTERNRRLLAQFADAVAFASHSFQLQASLAAETVTEAAITVDDGSYYLVELARAGAFDAYPDLQVVGSVHRGEGAVLQYLTANGSPSELRDRLATHPAVTDVAIVTEDDPVRIQVTVTERVPEVDLAAQGVVVRTTAIDPQGAVLSVELPPHAALQSVVETLQTAYGGVTAELQATVDRTMRDWRGGPFERADLTDKQRTALQAAYYNGYFAQPRRSTATEIAASLGVGHSTFLQHLHRAQEKVFASRFE
jgi:PAS domain S-box-containing protein